MPTSQSVTIVYHKSLLAKLTTLYKSPQFYDNKTNNNNNINSQISIAPYDHDFRGAGGRSDQCAENKQAVLEPRFEN